MQKKRVLFVFSFLYIFIATVVAQKLTANAPQQVAVGQQFRLSYTVNTQDVSGFRVGQIPDAFDVLMGPSQSSQSSFQIINGKTSQSSSITFTYILSATKNGTFTIPAATITAAGNQISSNSLKIVVSGQAQSGVAGSGNGRQRQQEPHRKRRPVQTHVRVKAQDDQHRKTRLHDQERPQEGLDGDLTAAFRLLREVAGQEEEHLHHEDVDGKIQVPFQSVIVKSFPRRKEMLKRDQEHAEPAYSIK